MADKLGDYEGEEVLGTGSPLGRFFSLNNGGLPLAEAKLAQRLIRGDAFTESRGGSISRLPTYKQDQLDPP